MFAQPSGLSQYYQMITSTLVSSGRVCSIMIAVYHLVAGQAATFSKNLVQLLNGYIAVNKLGVSALVHILDDFLIISKSKEEAITNLSAFINLCEDIGVPLSAAKTELPSQVMDFVGITLDIQKQETRLHIDKLNVNVIFNWGFELCLFSHPARACLLEKNDEPYNESIRDSETSIY